MRWVDVPYLDRRPLAREASGAERREPPAVRQAGKRVRLVHELRELRRTEELLESCLNRPDVDDRLGGDRVDVLGRHALAHDALHAVQANPECLLDQLANRAQAPVSEVLVLVELLVDGVAPERDGLGGVVLGVMRDSELVGQRNQTLDERDNVVDRENADTLGHVDLEPLVQLVAADLGEVVALRVEEEAPQQVASVLERRRLPGPLLLEHLDDRLLLAGGGVLLKRVDDVGRVVEVLEDLLVRAEVERDPVRAALGWQRPQERRHRELPLAVDARVQDALLVDLKLQPGAPGRHQVGREHLLGGILRLHQIGAGAAHELRHDHALSAVDDERPGIRHHWEVPHENGLLADLPGVLVDEADSHGERGLIREVLLSAVADVELRLAEPILAELDGERSGVVLDRRDVVDRFAQALRKEPREGGLLDIDEVGKVLDGR